MLILWDRKLANLLEGVVLLVPISDRLSYSTNLKTLYQHLLYKSINYLFALNNVRSNSPNFKWLPNSPAKAKKNNTTFGGESTISSHMGSNIRLLDSRWEACLINFFICDRHARCSWQISRWRHQKYFV